MATALLKPMARDLTLGDEPYKIVVSPEGVEIRRKGRRKRGLVSWDTILKLAERRDDAPKESAGSAHHDVPKAVASQIADELRSARGALDKASEKLREVTGAPAALRAEMDPDPVYGQIEDHWFIEPLLTPAEVASVLRISGSAAARLPIPSLWIGGERRFRQSEVRRYLRSVETGGGRL